MKTLIIYSSKKGATRKCGEQIKKGIAGEVKMIQYNEAQGVGLEQYDTIIMGSPVYAGNLDKDLKSFCTAHKELLKKKRSFLFLVCMSENQVSDYVKSNLPEEVTKHLRDVIYCGGALYFSKMNFFEKFIMKKIANSQKKSAGEIDRIDGKSDIEEFNKNNINVLIKEVNQAK